MASLGSFPYEAIAGKRYKSPHKNDLSFAKGDRIRVLSLAPKDEEDEEEEDDEEPDQWLVGETLDGTKTGTFPASHVQAVPVEEAPESPAVAAALPEQGTPPANIAQEDATSKEENISREAEPVADVETTQVEPTSPAIVPTISTGPTSEQEPGTIPIASPGRETASLPAVTPAISQKPASPAIAPKPSGMAARIAAFNRPQEAAAPPPLPRGKPGGWKRPAPAPGAEKPVLPTSSAAPPSKPTSTSPPAASAPLPVNIGNEESESASRTNAAFSAADAQSSIKMSLKERMAALQRGDSSDAAASKPVAPAPKPAPGRIAEEKQKAALAGMGGAAPVSKADEAPVIDGDSPIPVVEEGVPETAAKTEGEDVAETSQSKEDLNVTEGEEDDVVEEEKTEEEKESERRAAIAKRMASLGGRRMGGGPSIFGAPAPIPAKKPTMEETPPTPVVTTEEGMNEDSSSLSGKAVSREIEGEPEQPGKTLAVPRRAAPPRKKKSSASSVQTADSVGNVPQESLDSKTSTNSGLEKEVEGGFNTDSKLATGVVAGATAGALVFEGDHSLTEDPSSVDAASSFGDQASEFEPGTSISEGEMDENARQLEEFIRTPQEEVRNTLEGVQSSPPAPTTMPPIPVSSPPPPTQAPPIARPSSSRPPSTRPPVPKASLLNDNEPERTLSPAPTRAPPVPTAGRRESLLQTSSDAREEVKEEEEAVTQQSTILAKPKARMAEPAALSDNEDEEEVPATSKSDSFVSPIVPALESVAPTEDMTEEEEDRQRRARIAAKMSRMGGQPIMGAPIAFKNPTAPEPALLSEDYIANIEPEEASYESQKEAALSLPSTTSPPPIPLSMSPPPPVPQANVPPIPTKSPPPPMMQGSNSIERRMSQMSVSEDGSSMTRKASLLSRPPVPIGRSSREASSTTNIDEELANDQTEAFTPPALPSSPPPRAPPPRAPKRQPSQAEEERDSVAVSKFSSEDPSRRSSMQPPQSRRSPSKSSHDRTASRESAPRSSRDLDLMPSSRWWRHGLPIKLPPTLMRPDANPLVTSQDHGQQHSIRIELIFEDYSATVIEVHYEDDDATEEATQLSQHHSFPPRRPSSAELQSWSQRYGAPVAKQAMSALQSKNIIGNGSSKDFMFALLALTNNEEILPPVGSSFGSIILAQAATTPVDVGADEIRLGDIVALHGVDLKGKKGLSSYHSTFGSTQEPTYACVIESEAKKRKLRCILVAGVEGKRNRAPEEVSLRLDDVKSGLLRIFRLAPKSGWLSM